MIHSADSAPQVSKTSGGALGGSRNRLNAHYGTVDPRLGTQFDA